MTDMPLEHLIPLPTPSGPLPGRASVAIVGGGIMGTSIAFHLAQAGIRDIVLVERDTLGSGSSAKPLGGVRATFSDPGNITLGQRSLDGGTSRDLKSTTIDFLPPEETRGMRTRGIDEETVVAMYANNRAAEALIGGRLDDAYAWTREALRRDPSFMSAFNTLGVVYLRHGDVAEAARVFERVLASEPKNTRALANLVETRERQGRAAEAGALRARLAEIEPSPPFHYFNLGIAAMKRNDYRTARDLFAREVARADYYHEFHYWLGLADWQLGDVDAARKHLKLAMSSSTTRGQHDLYAAKLAWLQSHSQP